jgi:WD40-like Beta Propeller Repeat
MALLRCWLGSARGEMGLAFAQARTFFAPAPLLSGISMRHARSRALRWGGLTALVGACACSNGDRLVGRVDEVQAPSDGPFGPPSELTELTDPNADQQDPTLTRDELEFYFTRSVPSAPGDIWKSTRAAVSEPWALPQRVAELASDFNESTPEISADGLTLYFTSDRPDGVANRLWRSQRASRSSAWATPVSNTSPTPGTKDISPSLDDSGLWLAFGSVRGSSSGFDLFLTSRATPGDSWAAVQALDSLNSSSDDFDPALFFGATRIIFNSLRNDTGDLFQAARSTTRDLFGAPTPVTELNSPKSDGDPWVSADGRRIYFASSRSGVETMYRAER